MRIGRFHLFVLAVLSAMFVLCCDSEDSGDEQLPEHIAGHMEMESIKYSLLGIDYESGRSRIWYSFHRADEDYKNKPLFVMFNGGPGSSTAILMAWNTSPMTVDEHFLKKGELVAENPYSWTSIGNLLYIDARQTGFSYGLVEDARLPYIRQEEFGTKNHNFIFDAAEFIRVVLRFLKRFPEIQSNEVVMVGESYGGTRATTMLNLLLNYESWSNGDKYYADPALGEEIQEHFNAVFPDLAGKVIPPEKVASRFGRQIMIQPFTAGARQSRQAFEQLEMPGSPIYDVAKETGVDFVPCSEQKGSCDPSENIGDYAEKVNRDVYYMSKPTGWLLKYFFGGSAVLAQSEVLAAVTGVDLTSMDLMYAEEREEAFRGSDYKVSSISPDYTPSLSRWQQKLFFQMEQASVRVNGDLSSIYGELEPWDMFYISYAADVSSGFHSTTRNPYDENTVIDLLIENLGYVKTFITNATYDFVCYTPGVHRAIAEINDRVEKVEVKDDSFTVYFKPGLFGDKGPKQATVRYPLYEKSGHTVSYCYPEKLLNDVESWMAD